MIVRCVSVDVDNGMFFREGLYFASNQGRFIEVYDELNRCRVISSDNMRFCVRNDKPVPGMWPKTVAQFAYFKIEED